MARVRGVVRSDSVFVSVLVTFGLGCARSGLELGDFSDGLGGTPAAAGATSPSAGRSGDSNTGGRSGMGCGNAIVEAAEQCDDGNDVPGDGCSAACRYEPIAISSGRSHTCVVGSNGAVKCWGEGFYGALGLGDAEARGDDPGEMGENLPSVDLGSGRRAVSVSAGDNHTCALLDDASVKCWGSNDWGSLGIGEGSGASRGNWPGSMGDELPSVDLGSGRRPVAIGAGHATCVLFDDGAMKCWGYNSSGELGLGDDESRGDEPGEMGDRLPTVDLGTSRRATSFFTRYGDSCALLDDLSVKCWGYNANGSLGLGRGDSQNLGDEPGEMGDALMAVPVGRGRVKAVGGSGGPNCVIFEDGSLKCWGYNVDGELGLGDRETRGDELAEMGDALPRVDLGRGRRVTSVAFGGKHVCALLDDGSLKCWGENHAGQLGLGDRENRGDEPGEMGDALPPVNLGSGRRAKSIAAGTAHTCALLDDASVKCWGVWPLGFVNDVYVGDDPTEMGDNLPPVDLVF